MSPIMSHGRAMRGGILVGWAASSLLAFPAVAGPFPAQNVSLYSHVSLETLNAEFAEDCWGYVSESGREYAIIGLSTGTGFVEITDPGNPVIVDVVPHPNRARDMKVYQHYVYTIYDLGPGQIIDVADIDNGVVTLVNTVDQGAHNLAINEASGFIYAAVGGPMAVADLSNPINPPIVALWPGEAHDVQVVTYTEGIYTGREIAFICAGSTGRLDIVDVTDKLNMFLLGSTTYFGAAYTHQGWLSEDRHYFYLGDELDELNGAAFTRTFVVDVSDLSSPTVVNTFTSGLPATDHNLYVRGDFIYEANYAAGLRIFDACDPINPVEVGFFDTFPANDNTGFVGAWSVYPFFPSGTVIVSDRQSGLFILDVSEAIGASVCCLVVTNQEVVCHADGSTFTVTVDGVEGCTGGALNYSFTAAGGAVGEQLCVTLLVNGELGGFCCTTEICVTIPDCAPVGQLGDLDGDGIVGIMDLLGMLAAWGPCADCGTPQACQADLDGDCSVGILDLLSLLGGWG